MQIAVWGKIYKKEILKGMFFDENFKQMAEDFEYSLIIFEKVNSFAFVQERLFY